MEQLQLLITNSEKLRWKNANEKLNALLYQYRSVVVVSTQIEIADYNKCTIIRKKHLVEKYLRTSMQKAFVFAIHLN